MATDEFHEEFIEMNPYEIQRNAIALRKFEIKKIEDMAPAQRLVTQLYSCGPGYLGYHLARCILQDIAGNPKKVWVGHKKSNNGWYALFWDIWGDKIRLSPHSGPDGSGDWTIRTESNPYA